MMSREEILSFLNTNKAFMQKLLKVTKIGLFGSFATGENTNDSDIDIIVSMPPSFGGFYRLKEYLEDNLKTPIDLGLSENLRELVREHIANEIIYV
jgi:predicted nucleotidyltransferase